MLLGKGGILFGRTPFKSTTPDRFLSSEGPILQTIPGLVMNQAIFWTQLKLTSAGSGELQANTWKGIASWYHRPQCLPHRRYRYLRMLPHLVLANLRSVWNRGTFHVNKFVAFAKHQIKPEFGGVPYFSFKLSNDFKLLTILPGNFVICAICWCTSSNIALKIDDNNTNRIVIVVTDLKIFTISVISSEFQKHQSTKCECEYVWFYSFLWMLLQQT